MYIWVYIQVRPNTSGEVGVSRPIANAHATHTQRICDFLNSTEICDRRSEISWLQLRSFAKWVVEQVPEINEKKKKQNRIGRTSAEID